jgi:hypothetical protein
MLPNEMMLTKARFTAMIEDTVKNKQISYMEAIILLCEQNKLELEDMKKYVSDPIKEKLEAEAVSLNFLPRGNQLPI